MTLKPETIRAALTILDSVGRVSAIAGLQFLSENR